MLVIAWSGSLAVFNDEIGWLMTRELRADPSQRTRPLDDVITSLRERFPAHRFDVHLQSGARWAHTAYVYTPGRTTFVHVDPATARVTRADAMDGYTWNAVYFIRQLHVRLLMGLWGRVFVGLFGVTLVLSILTSLWIYRDWLTSLVRIRRHDGRRIYHMDLHKSVGAWALVINLMFGVTGAVLGLENLYYQVFPRRATPPAAFVPRSVPSLAPNASPAAAADALAAANPAFVPTVIQITPGRSTIIVRGDHPGALIAKDASFYRVDLARGVVDQARDARTVGWPSYLYNTLDPLHFGYFGDAWGSIASYAIKAAWCLLGLTPGVLSITGGYMWWLRRGRARSAAAARSQGAAPATPAPSTPWRMYAWYGCGLLLFVIAGYVLQAMVWERGWLMTEMLWQHWIVKPVCLIAVAFPLTLAAWAAGRAALAFATRRNRPGAAALAACPLGALYLVATSILN